jgi:REP element-mobilizing transposase RayT
MAPEDEAVARLALTLTQVSLELTAEACVLARDSQIIAYAGALPLEDIEEIRQTIAGDWEAAPAQGRIRFITLQGSGQDYMLYSRGVDGGFALSMIFSGTQQLHRIRRQGRRLADALAAVQEAAAPAAEAVPAAETAPAMPDEPAETGPLEPLTFLWLVRDPHFTLAAGTRQAVYHGLNDRLTRLGWQLYSLSVEEDHITLFADVPALKSPRERLQQLMERSADLVCRQHPEQDAAQLWAPSYLLLAPGRALRPEEIQDFLYFAGQS